MRRATGISQWWSFMAALAFFIGLSESAQAAQPSSPYPLAIYSDLSRAAVNDDGSYVTATLLPLNPPSGPFAIQAQRFDRRGTPLGSPIRVADPSGSLLPAEPAVASDGQGNFAVVWQRRGSVRQTVLVQRFDASGSRLGSEIEVSQDDTPSLSIAMNRSGSFAVGWTTASGVRLIYPTAQVGELLLFGFDSYFVTLSNTVHVRQFDAFGRALGKELQVVETAADSRRTTAAGTRQPSEVQFLELRLNLDTLGNGVAIWLRTPTQNGNQSLPRTTLVQRFDAIGAASGPRFTTDLELSRLGFDDAGNAVSVFGTANGIVGRRLAAGQTTTTPFPVADRTTVPGATGSPDTPAVSVSRGGSFVVGWAAVREAVPPGGSFPERLASGIAIQRFNASAVAQGAPVLVSGALPEYAAIPFASFPTIADASGGGGGGGESILVNWFQSSEPLNNRGAAYAASCCTAP